MSVYRVSGIFKYRGHAPGETFIATLPEPEETRAIQRGNIEVIHRGPVTIDQAKIRPPKG